MLKSFYTVSTKLFNFVFGLITITNLFSFASNSIF